MRVCYCLKLFECQADVPVLVRVPGGTIHRGQNPAHDKANQKPKIVSVLPSPLLRTLTQNAIPLQLPIPGKIGIRSFCTQSFRPHL